MSDDANLTVLLASVVNDETLRKRLAVLQGKLDELTEARAGMQRTAEENQGVLAENQKALRALEAARDDLKMREDALIAEREALTGVINNHTAERSRWEAARKAVDAEHIDRAAQLADGEKTQDAIMRRQYDKEAELREREAKLVEREAAHAAAARHAKAFSEAVAP